MKVFWIKVINCIIIVVAIIVYQQGTVHREQKALAHEQKIREEKKEWEKESRLLMGDSYVAKYKDGTYLGKGNGFGGEIVVEVTIEEDYIESVDIVSATDETPDYVKMMPALIEKIVENQNTEVDVVSGATFSSNGVLDAVDDALLKAGVK